MMRLLRDSSDTVNAKMTLRDYIEPAKDWETWVWGAYCLVRPRRDVSADWRSTA